MTTRDEHIKQLGDLILIGAECENLHIVSPLTTINDGGVTFLTGNIDKQTRYKVTVFIEEY